MTGEISNEAVEKSLLLLIALTIVFTEVGLFVSREVSAAGTLAGKYLNQGNTIEDILSKW